MIKKLKTALKVHLIFLTIVSINISVVLAAEKGKWGTDVGEALDALKMKGDPEEGEDYYDVCAACHLPNGWGDPAGTFPQLAGQHATVIIKQIADIRAKNRDNPTMYPFAKNIEGAGNVGRQTAEAIEARAKALADVSAYVQTLSMNPSPIQGPGGPSYILSGLRNDAALVTMNQFEKKVSKAVFKKLKTFEEVEFNSKNKFLAKLKAILTSDELKKYQTIILKQADWSSDLKLGKKLYEENCVKCHGDHGQGNYKDYYPVIASQTYLYLLRQFNWIKIGKRRNANPDMVKQINGFSQLDMRSVVDYAGRFRMKEGDWKKIEVQEESDEF